MKLIRKLPPREFRCGIGKKILIKDCARVELDADEQVTFVSSGKEYDVTRKSFGYYATPSLNGRLKDFGLRGVLVKNSEKRFYVMLVEKGREKDFEAYLNIEKMKVVTWLDSDDSLAQLEKKLGHA